MYFAAADSSRGGPRGGLGWSDAVPPRPSPPIASRMMGFPPQARESSIFRV